MIAGVRERLLEAVRLRLRADVPVGILLSGGLDSSAVAGMVAHLMKEGTKLGDERTQHLSRMKVFTVQFDKDSGIDESGLCKPFMPAPVIADQSRHCAAYGELAGRQLPSRGAGRDCYRDQIRGCGLVY